MRRLALGALLAVLAAGLAAACGSRQEAASTTTAAAPAAAPTTTAAAPQPKPAPRPRPHPLARPQAQRLHAVLVTVLDGDTNARVRRSRVTVGGHSARTDAHGIARVPLHRRAALVTVARHRGYIPRAVRLSFRTHPRSTMRIYQRSLQWPIYGAVAARTQAQSTIRVRPPFRVVWSRGVGSLIEFPAVVSEGVAYIGNYGGTVYAVNMRNGKLVWRYDPPGGKMASSPAIAGDELVVHGMDGLIRILDRHTGRLKRHFYVGSPVESSPIVWRGVDYFGAWNGRVYAYDVKRNRIIWTHVDGCKITSSASIAGGRLFIGDYCGRIVALAPRTGALEWSGGVNGRVYGTPAVAGGRVFVPSSTGNSLTAFTTGGRELWSRGTGAYVYSSPAAVGGRVFFGSYDGLLYAVSARSGSTLWTVGAGGPVSGAVSTVAGVVYAGSTHGSIVGADARSGRVLLRFPHGEYVPVSGGGRRLLLHGYSRLYGVVRR